MVLELMRYWRPNFPHIDFFYTAGAYMLKLVQRLFSEMGLALGTAQNNLSAGGNYRLLTDVVAPSAHEEPQGLLDQRSQIIHPGAGPSRLPPVASIYDVPPAPLHPAHRPVGPAIASDGASRNVRVGRGQVPLPSAASSSIPPIRSIRKVPRVPRQPANRVVDNRVLDSSGGHEDLNEVPPLNSQDGTWRPGLSSEQLQAEVQTNIEPHTEEIEPASEDSTPAASPSGTPVRASNAEEEQERGIAIGPGLWRCLECGMEIRGRRANLNRHIENRHDLVRKFECPNADCGKKFQTKVNLDRHVAGVHEGRPLKCSKCPRDFKTPEGLSEHNRIAHEKARTLACKTCGKCYGRRSSLRRHSKVHKKERAAATEAASAGAGPSGQGQS